MIKGDKKKENVLVMPKRLLHALIMSHFYLGGMVAGASIWVLDREIEDVRIDGDYVVVTYKEDKE